jgi:hypothetical protein
MEHPPPLVQALDRPVCVLSAGLHDQAVQGITMEIFLSNVQYYLEMMAPQCSHIIWVSMTSPKSDRFSQTRVQTLKWNDGVLNLLTRQFADQSSFVEVFEASMRHLHIDNIHMHYTWDRRLASMFGQVIDALQQQQQQPLIG